MIYLETARDHDRSLKSGSLVRKRVTPHEIGHQFGLHGDTDAGFGIMSIGVEQPRRFVDRHLNILRCRQKSPGRGPGDP